MNMPHLRPIYHADARDDSASALARQWKHAHAKALLDGDADKQTKALATAAVIIQEHAPAPDAPWQAPAVADLAWRAGCGSSRAPAAAISLMIVFIDEGGRGVGRVGRLIMERIDGQGSTGALYPALTMAEVSTDAAWDGALHAALHHGTASGFAIPSTSDVRWSVEVVPAGERWDIDSPTPLQGGASLMGRSAGVAFLIGLFHLVGKDVPPATRTVLERLVALAVLPDPAPDDESLHHLGGQERAKLDALKALPQAEDIIVLFPADYTGRLPDRVRSCVAATVPQLIAELRRRVAGSAAPDTIPQGRRTVRYIGGSAEVKALAEDLNHPGITVITGPGGVGKTSRTLEAVASLDSIATFPDGLLWVDFYFSGAEKPAIYVATSIIEALGYRPDDEEDVRRAQVSHLLARRRVLILLEGAETVPEGEIGDVVGLSGGNATVVWMTRRASDARHSALAGGRRHEVNLPCATEALQMLLDSAERTESEVSPADLPAWQSIVAATERLPLFLVWAGHALRPEHLISPVEYLAELQHDPLGNLADPEARLRKNAGRFLRRSLARMRATSECPDLPGDAARLFATVAAFHPVHGAPLPLVAVASGMGEAQDRRRLAKARHALLSLGLLAARPPKPDDGRPWETLHPVHVLAASVAADLWQELPAEYRRSALDKLAVASRSSISAERPTEWPHNQAWLRWHTALADHWHHWLIQAGLDARSAEAAELCDAWEKFLLGPAASQVSLNLDESGWRASVAHWRIVSDASPNEPLFARSLAASLRQLGDTRRARPDFAGAGQAYTESIKLSRQLAHDHPDTPDLRLELSVSLSNFGDLLPDLGDSSGAEQARNESLEIARQLVHAHPDVLKFQCHLSSSLLHRSTFWNVLGNRSSRVMSEGVDAASHFARAHPEVPDFQHHLCLYWNRLGDMRMMIEDWAVAEHAYQESIKISRELVHKNPDEPDFQITLSGSLRDLGGALWNRGDLAGAEQAYREGMKIARELAHAYPDTPGLQLKVYSFWNELGDRYRIRDDWAGAEQAYSEAMQIAQQMAHKNPDATVFQYFISISWNNLGNAREARKDWTAAEEAYAEGMKISEKLAEAHPGVAKFQLQLSEASSNRDLLSRRNFSASIPNISAQNAHASAPSVSP